METPSKKPQAICRTANLTLASFLTMSGEPYRLVRGQGQSAAWEFDAELEGRKKDFDAGTATVEPQSFHHAITRTRRLLFDFIASEDSSWDKDKVMASPHWQKNGKS